MGAEITLLLQRLRAGDNDAFDELARHVYPELKAMARGRTRGKSEMGATVLVNETFLKLLKRGEITSADRAQFFGLSATIMRQVIIDEIKYATAAKRHGLKVTFGDQTTGEPSPAQTDMLLDIDRALDQLRDDHAQLVQVVECRYFVGYTTAETAEALAISPRTVERLWSDARRRLAALIENEQDSRDE